MVSWWPGKLRLNLQVLFRLVSYSQTYGIKLNSTPPAVPLINDLHGALLYFFFSFLFFCSQAPIQYASREAELSRFWLGIKRSSREITAFIVEEGSRGGSRRLRCVFFFFSVCQRGFKAPVSTAAAWFHASTRGLLTFPRRCHPKWSF